MSRIVNILRAGKLNYNSGIKLQQFVANQHHNNQLDLINSTNNCLILTEHYPVYTIGLRTKNYTIKDQLKLEQLGAEFHKTNRGGLITFHGPGQLVVYPIINLKNFNPSIRWYVCQIEKTIIDLCNCKYNLNAKTSPDTGVWIDDRKICAIGLHASRYITTHGLALNCNTDLDWFKHIVPCGIEGKSVTSLTTELGTTITIDNVLPQFLNSFSKIFQCHLIEMTEEQKSLYLNCIK